MQSLGRDDAQAFDSRGRFEKFGSIALAQTPSSNRYMTPDFGSLDANGMAKQGRQMSKTPRSAHSSPWATSETIWLVGVAAAVILEYPLPISLDGLVPAPYRYGIGAVLLVAGAGLVALAQRDLKRADQPSAPGIPTTALLTHGIFGYSRNPIYLGGIVALAGLGLATNWPWLLIMLVPVAIATDVILIRPEERYLAASFGEDYEAYRARVRRWF
jgi:protein-S-isoprenylcysteine O-methyltransferase Ste14